MSIGVCCQWMEAKSNRNGTVKWINAFAEKNLQLGQFISGKYNDEQIKNIYLNNINGVVNKLPEIIQKGIKSFRISSNLLPLIDKVSDEIKYDRAILDALTNLGKIVLENNIRLTCHPSQFCVLSSKNPEVIKNSFQILDHHAWIFDRMGLPQSNYYAINIHGGVKGQFKVLVESINNLMDNVKNRLTLENEELAYNVQDLYEVYKETGISIVYDSHHHKFNPGDLLGNEAMELAMSTWKEKPLTHLSNTEIGLETAKFQDRRKHSDYVNFIPIYQLEANNENKIDIDFEFKMKNEAIFKAVDEFGIKL